MIRIRYAWSSLHVLPYLLCIAAMGYLAIAHWDRGGPGFLLILVYPLLLAIHRVARVEFMLGERWMKVPGPHAWHEAVVPSVGLLGAFRTEPSHSDGRYVRLEDVASWRSTTDGFELRMRDGSVRVVPFHGLRPRDARRVIEYLYEKIGDRHASKD